jgi:hypothetical protein
MWRTLQRRFSVPHLACVDEDPWESVWNSRSREFKNAGDRNRPAILEFSNSRILEHDTRGDGPLVTS